MLTDRRPILLANARLIDPSRDLDGPGELLVAREHPRGAAGRGHVHQAAEHGSSAGVREVHVDAIGRDPVGVGQTARERADRASLLRNAPHRARRAVARNVGSREGSAVSAEGERGKLNADVAAEIS